MGAATGSGLNSSSDDTSGAGSRLPERYRVLLILTLVYAVNVADRFVVSTLIEPIKAAFGLTDAAVGFLTGVAFALCYAFASLPLGLLADRAHRRNMLAVAITVWSLFTALGGLAHNFWHFLIARVGVGLGEAGATPASHSILADYFPASERTIAMSVFAFGIAIGSAMGGIIGGLVSESFGWRSTMLLFALFNLPVLAMLMCLREPARGASDPAPPAPGHAPAARGFAEVARFMRGQRALLHILAGGAIADFAKGGLAWWTPAFLARSHGFTTGGAGLQVGLMSGLGGALVLVAVMLVMVRMMGRDPRWPCRFLAIFSALVTLPGIAAYLVGDSWLALLLLWLFIPFANFHVGPALALLQNLTPSAMRGLVVAIFLFATNMANLALAPQIIGLLSDTLATTLGNPGDALGIALSLSAIAGFWAAWHFHAAIRTLREDITRANGPG
ncbi:MFS transporter [Altererythrobacter xixiisoli]|uniref:MFS transporter n=1 Tax=Croceibacterium xixiisoli TaxID=1476466 RepID=A0A6I4TWF3_9SPHN|nr:MFS transporter [Croceibacterium xixiisoli]MXO99549.1 MFS transporter [Croceibacterium xixiisoli]